VSEGEQQIANPATTKARLPIGRPAQQGVAPAGVILGFFRGQVILVQPSVCVRFWLLARFLLLATQVRASATRRAPIRAGTAGSLPDLAPGPAAAFRSVFQNMPALQNLQLPPLAA
jgi:hypothetical protein